MTCLIEYILIFLLEYLSVLVSLTLHTYCYGGLRKKLDVLPPTLPELEILSNTAVSTINIMK